MSNNVTIQKQGASSTPALARPSAWDPFQAMRELFRWDPLQLSALMPLQADVSFAPSFEVKENKESFIFKADLPGVAEKDLQVQLNDNRLSVSGKRESEKTEQNETYYASERSYGSFTRSFTLPEGVDADKAHAELKNGVLSIAIPKRPEAQPRKINVTSK
ncbi:MAG TPA: Hsp20/alpha crystallin family protein [Polyangiaceae bacterium]|nr:Hsp20/alpha crystallin family protein [Polyangiaceae bacterium]